MFVSATQKDARMSPRKIRPYARMIQGMSAEKAVHQLTFAVGKAPEILLHVLKSSMANAINTHEISPDSLKVSSILVNQGLVMKRFMPVAKGMAHPILKRTAHVTVIVEGTEVATDGKKKAKKAVVKSMSADEFAVLQEKEHSADHDHEEHEVSEAHLSKKETSEPRSTMTEFQKTKFNQQSGDVPGGKAGAKKTHRRKSIG